MLERAKANLPIKTANDMLNDDRIDFDDNSFGNESVYYVDNYDESP